jgi:dipeptide/tripeptide permease
MAASEIRRTSRGNSGEVAHFSLLAASGPASDEPFDDVSSIGTFSADENDSNGNGNGNKLLSCIPGPPWVINILLSELCERFSFYALRAILVLFFKERLGWSRDSAVSIFFFSSALSYFMPLFGGYVADSKLGRFKTILGFSAVYVVGSFVLALSAATSPEPFFINGTEISNGTSAATESAEERAASEQAGAGAELRTETDTAGSAVLAIFALVLIAIGTGGIKPNVSSFGADQFTGPTRAEDIGKFFSIFYFCINTGSVVSFIISPILRVNAGYGVAFALPTVLLSVATLIFWSARDKYVKKPLGKSPVSVLWNVLTAALSSGSDVRHANLDDVASSDSRANHWLNRARGVCSEQDVNDTIDVWRQGSLLLTLPIFWTLYDQQGSAWTLQAETMNLHGFLQPEQLGVINPILILCLIPIFEQYIYPAYEKSSVGRRYPATSLMKIGIGMIFASLAFVISALVQSSIDSAEPNSISVFAQLPQILIISISEILVSITALEFVYDTAPFAMKSTCSSLFLCTTAVGDVLGGGLYSILGPNMSGAGLFMLCAVLMLLNTVLFAYVAQGYIHPEKSMNTDAGQNKYEAPAAENQNSITPISTTSLTDGNSSGIADTL